MRNLEDALGFAKLKEVYRKKIVNTRKWKWKSMPIAKDEQRSLKMTRARTTKDSLKRMFRATLKRHFGNSKKGLKRKIQESLACQDLGCIDTF